MWVSILKKLINKDHCDQISDLNFNVYINKKKKNFGSKKLMKCFGTMIIKNKGMFGNCFFPLFFVFKNNFLFLRLKNLFGNSKWAENKNCFQNSICEGN